VLIGAVLAVVGLFALASLTDLLRHPLPEPPARDEPVNDPRVEIQCGAEEVPREGQQREERTEAGVVAVTSNALYDCPNVYDEQRVRYTGEVVGALMARDDGAWTQLNDDVYALGLGPLPAHRDFRGGNAGIGVWLPAEVVAEVDAVGGPRASGDVLEVVGTFHRVDPATAEVAVIRVETGRVVQPGAAIEDPPLRDRRLVAILLTLLALALVVVERVAARRR
jgi:hypothetical protein